VSPEDAVDDEVPDTDTLDPAERVPVEDGPAPLESDPADWQDQHTDVGTDPDEDFRSAD
jgi:hypothetical protein